MGDTVKITSASTPIALSELVLPADRQVVVLAPHPDDFDAIAVALGFLQEQGHCLHLAVLTAGAGGITDGWEGVHGVERKAAVREAEQRASCRLFGLPEERIHFLRLWEQDANEADDYTRLRSYLLERQPHLVLMPHGNDANRTHRRTYESVRRIVMQERLKLLALLNEDPKTMAMRADVHMPFDEERAIWKGELLRLHRSQQERNLATRGQGFDERILHMNRAAAIRLGSPFPYAEVFELQRFD